MPLFGWTWYFAEMIFLRRNWQKDQFIIRDSLKTLTDYPQTSAVSLFESCGLGVGICSARPITNLNEKKYRETEHNLRQRASTGWSLKITQCDLTD